MTNTDTLDELGEALALAVTDSTLIDEVLLRSRRRIRTTMRYTTSSCTEGQLREQAQAAICLGVWRARMNRFCMDRAISKSKMADLRRAANVAGNYRQLDTTIIARAYPEFPTFVCIPALSREEVLATSVLEFRDSIAGPETDYGEMRRQASALLVRGDIRTGNHPSVEAGGYDETREYQSDTHALGVAFSRAAALALREYGKSGMYWIAQRLLCEGRFAPLINLMSDVELVRDEKQYLRLKKELARKLPMMDKHLMPLLRDDPLMQEVFQSTLEVVRAGPVPRPTLPDLSQERAGSRERCRARLIRRASGDPMLHGFVDFMRTLAGQPLVEVLNDFMIVETNEAEWPLFRKRLFRKATTQTQ